MVMLSVLDPHRQDVEGAKGKCVWFGRGGDCHLTSILDHALFTGRDSKYLLISLCKIIMGVGTTPPSLAFQKEQLGSIDLW